MTHTILQVTVAAEYWHGNTPEHKTVRPAIPVNAELETLIFYDDKVTSGYVMRLLVYENTMLNPALVVNEEDAIEVIVEPEDKGCKYTCTFTDQL